MHLTRTLATGIGLLASLLLGALPPAVAANEQTGQRLLDAVHTDVFALYLDNEQLALATRADVPEGNGTRLQPANLVFAVTDVLKKTAPTSAAYDFLGVTDGSPIWVIPQSYQPGALWAGWSTENLPHDGSITSTKLTLQNMDGPGNLEIYVNEVDGPERLFSSTDVNYRSTNIDVGVHAHANWVFTAAGTYTLTMSASATTSSGTVLQSAPQTYQFTVGGTAAGDQTAPTGNATTPTTDQQVASAVLSDSAIAEECLATTVTRTISAADVEVVTAGHFDIGLNAAVRPAALAVKDDRSGSARWADPANYVFHLTDAAAAAVPSGEDYAFLGTSTVWMVPLTQKAGVPWLGWNTQHPSVAGNTTGDITLTLESVTGPGQLAVYDLETLGSGVGNRYFGTVSGFPRSTQVPVGASGVHAHAIWAFTKPGAYTVTLSMAGTIDGSPTTATSAFTFFVGPGDAASAVQERTVTQTVGRTASGEECALVLAQTGTKPREGVATAAAAFALLGGSLILFGLVGRPRTNTSRPSAT